MQKKSGTWREWRILAAHCADDWEEIHRGQWSYTTRALVQVWDAGQAILTLLAYTLFAIASIIFRCTTWAEKGLKSTTDSRN